MTKERLRSYQDLKQEREQIKGLIGELESEILAPKVLRQDGMPGGKGGNSNPTEDMWVRHFDLLNMYHGKQLEIDRELAAIEAAIESLGSMARQVLRLRYIKGHRWELICAELNYSWRQVHRIHAEALKSLATREDQK